MTVDKKYSSLPTLRKVAKVLWPLWMVLLVAKIAYVVAPLHSTPELADTAVAGVLVLAGVLSVGLWIFAGLGSKRERSQPLICHVIVLAISLAMVCPHPMPRNCSAVSVLQASKCVATDPV